MTERKPGRPALAMRRLQRADWPAVHSWARLDVVCRYQPWGPNTEDQTEAFVTAVLDDEDRHLWVGSLPDGASPGRGASPERAAADRVVGMVELHVVDAASGLGELGYGVHPDAWGLGLATRMAAAALAHGFSTCGLHRVEATCDPRNVASAAVLRRIGMRHEGTLRQNVRLRDGWRDSEVFGALAGEWRPPAGTLTLG